MATKKMKMSVWYLRIGMNAFCLNFQPNVGKKNNNESFGENISLSFVLTGSFYMHVHTMVFWFFHTHMWEKSHLQ